LWKRQEKLLQEVTNTYLRTPCTKDMHKYILLIIKEIFVKYVIKRSSCDNGLDLFPPYGNIGKKQVHIGENKRYGWCN